MPIAATGLPPRLSEFAILCTARFWRAQYEWFAHAPIAEKSGVKSETIEDLRCRRPLHSAPEDECAIHDFIQELYDSRRISEVTYRRVNSQLGDAGTVELVGLLGYYSLVSMTLNVFQVPPPDGEALPFAEPD